MSSAYGCGGVLVIRLLNKNELHTFCGAHHDGEILQCEFCQESKPLPFNTDTEDPDAAAERALELERPAGVTDAELMAEPRLSIKREGDA